MIYEPDTTGLIHPNVTSSWNMQMTSQYANFSLKTGGTGQINVQFLSSNLINVYFSFSTIANGITYINKSFAVSGPTENIYLSFNYPPSEYYVSNDCFMFDNYVEKDINPTLSMS